MKTGREEGHRLQALVAPPAEGRLGVERLNWTIRCQISLSGFARYREGPLLEGLSAMTELGFQDMNGFCR